MEDLLQVGVITTTHGVMGEVKVFPTTDDPARFKKLKNVVLDTGKELVDLEVAGVKFFKNMVIVKFKGREMSHLDVGRELLERFREACADLGGSDKAPSLDGRFMSVFITPNSKREGASAQSKGKGKKPAATAAAATPEDKSAEK